MKLLGVSLDGNPIYIVTEYCGKVSDISDVDCSGIRGSKAVQQGEENERGTFGASYIYQ